MGWIIGIVILLLVIAGGGIGIWLVVRAKKTKKAAKKTPVVAPPVVAPAVVAPVAAVAAVAPGAAVPVFPPLYESQPTYVNTTKPPAVSQIPPVRAAATPKPVKMANEYAAAQVQPQVQAPNSALWQKVAEAKNRTLTEQETAQKEERKAKNAALLGKIKANKGPAAPKNDNSALWQKVAQAKNRTLTAQETAQKEERKAKNAALLGKVKANKAGASAAVPATTGTGTGTWMRASATWYTSHPKCCKGASNYDPKANKDECDKYSGCKWAGAFAGVDKKLSIAEVAARNIVAFYDAKNQKGDKKAAESWWNKNVKGKKIELKKPDGTTMIVEALDTCSDSDTQGGECTKNANKNNGGGILIDLEESTAKRFYPGGKIKDNSSIEWRWAK